MTSPYASAAQALLGLSLLLTSYAGYGQLATTDMPTKEEAKEAVGVTQGVPLPTGVSYFANPDNYHNLTLGVQAGLGVSEKSATFGYDNLAVSTRWKLGDNKLGRHLNFLAGFSDWRVPAYRKVFPDSVIDPLPKQDRFAAQSATAASLGLSFSVGRDNALDLFKANKVRVDSIYLLHQLLVDKVYPSGLTPAVRQAVLDKSKQAVQNSQATPITEADLDRWSTSKPSGAEKANLVSLGFPAETIDLWFRPIATLKQNQLRARLDQLVLKSYRDAQLRRDQGFAFSAGALFRLADFSTETDVQAYDLFSTMAYGVGTVDIVVAGHYLHYLDNTLPRSAFTTAAGLYARLSDNGPTPVLGLTASYGYYAFRELHDVVPEAHKHDRNPQTNRFDLVLSYSGAPDKQQQTSAGLGIRYSRIMPSLLPAYNAFSLVFSTNFSLIK